MTNQLTYTDTKTSEAVRTPTTTITLESAERPRRPSSGRRKIVIAGTAALAATVAIGLAVTGNDSAEPAEPNAEQRPAYLIVQDEIDAALAERATPADLDTQRPSPADQPAQADATPEAKLPPHMEESEARNEVGPSETNSAPRSAAQIIQDEIDAALADHGCKITGPC